MSDKFITLDKMHQWLDALDEALKNRTMATQLADSEGREQLYNLYQAAQLLRVQVLADFSEEVEFNNGRYDLLDNYFPKQEQE